LLFDKEKFPRLPAVGDVYYFTVVFALDGGWNRKKKKVDDPTIFLRHYAPTNTSKFSTSTRKSPIQNCVPYLSAFEAHFTNRNDP
jgi:hypothetical protein